MNIVSKSAGYPVQKQEHSLMDRLQPVLILALCGKNQTILEFAIVITL